MKRGQTFFVIALACLAVAAAFQNCTPAMRTVDVGSRGVLADSVPTPTPTPTATPTPTPTPTPGTVFNNLWSPLNATGAPGVRCQHATAVVGAKMFVWGGVNPSVSMPVDGFLYDTATSTWTAIATAGAPSGRNFASAVSTGTKVIVWGGQTTTELNSGSMYDLGTNTWTAVSNTGAPAARYNHVAVWAGTKMIIYGGLATVAGTATALNTGALFDPATNTWSAMSTSGAPLVAGPLAGVWTGSKLIVWGGGATGNAGGIYDPTTNTWATMSAVNAPSARNRHGVFWNGSKVIVWGGVVPPANSVLNNSGGVYDPATDTWTAMNLSGVPAGALDSSMAFTGTKLVAYESQIGQGGYYDPQTDTWNSVSTTGAPATRFSGSAAWVADRFIEWGGCYNDNGTIKAKNDGASYQ